ncbi:MAG: hypothetical protein M3Y72_01910 [Acidobacteriota bacterium]|nr:hypothetical protein [Acidobacteriota bacterium]
MTSLSSPKTSYALCGVAALLALFLPSPYPLLLLTAAALTLAVELPATRKRLKRIALPVAFFVLLFIRSEPARAMLPVFDAGAFAQMGKIWSQDISNYQKLVQEVALAGQIYQTEMQNYQLARTMATALQSKNIYAVQGAVQMGNSFVQSHYGEAAGWSQAMNLGISIPAAYGHATLPLALNTTFLAAQQLGSSDHLATLGRVGIIDDTSQRSMAISAQIAQQQSRNAAPVQQWESSVVSTNPALNTAAAQQNLTNLGMVQLYEQGRADLAVNNILAQQITLQNMKDRDAAVVDLNRWQKVSEYQETQAYDWGGAEAGIENHQPY